MEGNLGICKEDASGDVKRSDLMFLEVLDLDGKSSKNLAG